MQNSDEYSQEWKSSTLQAQNQRDRLRDQIWATGLNSSTSLHGAREQALEYLVKCLIRFQNRTFNQINNNYAAPSFKRICAEFGISSGTDFRFKEGDNHGLRSVFIYVLITSSEIRVEKPSKAIWLISFGMTTKMLKIILTFSWQISQKVWRKPGWRDRINL